MIEKMIDEINEVEVVEEVKEVKFTKRDALNAFISGEITLEAKEWAENELTRMDAANQKRRETKSKAQIENEKVKANILEFLEGQEDGVLAGEVGEALGITTAKASSLLRVLAGEGLVDNSGIVKSGVNYAKTYKVMV